MVALFVSWMLCVTAINDAPRVIQDFSLLSTRGEKVSLSSFPQAKGVIVVFTCNHCPFAKLYTSRMNNLWSMFEPLGVPLIAISSTDTLVYEEDSFEQMKLKAVDEKFLFPYLFDGEQDVARMFAAQKTPHAFVIWRTENTWSVRYSGAIDDNGAEPQNVTRRFVEEAVREALDGNQVTTPVTHSIGCQINFRKKKR